MARAAYHTTATVYSCRGNLDCHILRSVLQFSQFLARHAEAGVERSNFVKEGRERRGIRPASAKFKLSSPMGLLSEFAAIVKPIQMSYSDLQVVPVPWDVINI